MILYDMGNGSRIVRGKYVGEMSGSVEGRERKGERGEGGDFVVPWLRLKSLHHVQCGAV